MSLSEFAFPTRIVFGAGARARLANELARLGVHRPLVVTDRGVREAGVLADAIGAEGRGWPVHDVLSTNPVGADAEGGAERCRAEGCDGIVAVGGGAPMDVGKLVRVLVTHDLALADFAAGAAVEAPLPPMVALPTTAGTGSEVGRSAVVTLLDLGRKVVVFAPSLVPSVAVCDPELTIALPPRPTAATGFDALAHGVEAYLSVGYHPMADAIGLACVRLAAGALGRAVANGDDLAARSDMMMAATMGAVAFQKGLGICHALSHPLSTVAGLHHGLANALMLPAALRWNEAAVPERVADVAVALGEKREPARAAVAVECLRSEVGLPDRLSACGVERTMLDALADGASKDGCLPDNPRPATPDELRALYESAL